MEGDRKSLNNEAICGVFVNKEKQTLLVRRSMERTYNPGSYDLMGGDIISGEKPIETLFRDAREKLGIQLNGEIIELKEPRDIVYSNKTVKTYVFVCQIDSNTSIQLDPHKYDGYGWYYPEQIAQLPLSPKVKKVLVAVGLLRQ